jgi:mutator protein MutT
MGNMSTSSPVIIAIAVVRHAGRVLIGQRPPGVPLAGLWEFPGGKARLAEPLEQAAARECLEETGLVVRIGNPYPDAVYQYEHGCVHLHFFAAEPIDPAQPAKNPFVWVRIEDLEKYTFPAANQAVVGHVMQEEFARKGLPFQPSPIH